MQRHSNKTRQLKEVRFERKSLISVFAMSEIMIGMKYQGSILLYRESNAKQDEKDLFLFSAFTISEL